MLHSSVEREIRFDDGSWFYNEWIFKLLEKWKNLKNYAVSQFYKAFFKYKLYDASCADISI